MPNNPHIGESSGNLITKPYSGAQDVAAVMKDGTELTLDEWLEWEDEKKVRLAEGSTDPKETCPICLSEFVRSLEMTQLPCKHAVCSSCIRDWLEASSNKDCPLCRCTLTHSCGHVPQKYFLHNGGELDPGFLEQDCGNFMWVPYYCGWAFDFRAIQRWLDGVEPPPMQMVKWFAGETHIPPEMLTWARNTDNEQGQRLMTGVYEPNPPRVLHWFVKDILGTRRHPIWPVMLVDGQGNRDFGLVCRGRFQVIRRSAKECEDPPRRYTYPPSWEKWHLDDDMSELLDLNQPDAVTNIYLELESDRDGCIDPSYWDETHGDEEDMPPPLHWAARRLRQLAKYQERLREMKALQLEELSRQFELIKERLSSLGDARGYLAQLSRNRRSEVEFLERLSSSVASVNLSEWEVWVTDRVTECKSYECALREIKQRFSLPKRQIDHAHRMYYQICETAYSAYSMLRRALGLQIVTLASAVYRKSRMIMDLEALARRRAELANGEKIISTIDEVPMVVSLRAGSHLGFDIRHPMVEKEQHQGNPLEQMERKAELLEQSQPTGEVIVVNKWWEDAEPWDDAISTTPDVTNAAEEAETPPSTGEEDHPSEQSGGWAGLSDSEDEYEDAGQYATSNDGQDGEEDVFPSGC
ncbi:hypothetical protein BJ170DRAFT_593870 [Xylariales sp. AK1849]|nr:hypothetical protein BJ170DRAFT_593870 [Xylariales sp. AK1849]